MPKEKIPAPGLPVNESCANCGEPIKVTDSWGRDENRMRVHFTKCMPKTFNPEQLDAEWRRLADENNTTVKHMVAELDKAAQTYESLLYSLRKVAKRSLAKGDATN